MLILAIFTDTIRTFFGLPDGANALAMFRAVHTDPAVHARVVGRYGVCLVGRDFFSKRNAQNLFGSTQFADGYEGWVSWTKERERVRDTALQNGEAGGKSGGDGGSGGSGGGGVSGGGGGGRMKRRAAKREAAAKALMERMMADRLAKEGGAGDRLAEEGGAGEGGAPAGADEVMLLPAPTADRVPLVLWQTYKSSQVGVERKGRKGGRGTAAAVADV